MKQRRLFIFVRVADTLFLKCLAETKGVSDSSESAQYPFRTFCIGFNIYLVKTFIQQSHSWEFHFPRNSRQGTMQSLLKFRNHCFGKANCISPSCLPGSLYLMTWHLMLLHHVNFFFLSFLHFSDQTLHRRRNSQDLRQDSCWSLPDHPPLLVIFIDSGISPTGDRGSEGSFLNLFLSFSLALI